MVRSSSVLSILTWKCASRHNGVHFFMSHLASWLRTRRFSEPTFRPSEAPNHWKNTVCRDFPTFSRICIFFLLTLLSSNLSLLSASSLLCFSSVHIVGSLASKLPSMKWSSPYSVVHLLPTSPSKSAPRPQVLYDFYVKASYRYSPAALFVNNFPRSSRAPRKQRPSLGDQGRHFTRKNTEFRARECFQA